MKDVNTETEIELPKRDVESLTLQVKELSASLVLVAHTMTREMK